MRRNRASGVRAVAASVAVVAGLCIVDQPVRAATNSSSIRAELGAYVVKGKEERGFQLKGMPQVTATPAAFAALSGAKDATRLKHEGFSGYLAQATVGPSALPGLSSVMRLGSASSARAEAAAELRADSAGGGSTVSTFAVSGVPGAHGVSYSGGGSPGSASNVLFVEGRCFLLVGDGSQSNHASVTSTRNAAIAGVKAIYHRTAHTHGACSG
jgi:hypothetical protein